MKHICSLPWMGFSNDPNGVVRPCCISNDIITDEKDQPMYIQKNTVKEIFHSKFMNNLREEFKNGNKPEGCKTCWVDEDNNYISKRLRYLDIHKDSFDPNIVPDYPEDYQLILTNACNLKCRSCGTSHSTSWTKEVLGMDIEDANFISQHNYDLPYGQSGDKNSVFLKDIDNWASKVRRMEVVGGEPFYTKVWEKVWYYLIENDYSKNIDLTMSTNCTVFNKDLVTKLVNNFDLVGIGLSIDGLGDVFEYLRKNANWEETKDNLIKYYQLHQELNTHKLTLNYTFTVSWINAIILPEMTQWVRTNTPGIKIWYNLVHWPNFMSLCNIPIELKKEIESKLKSYDWGNSSKDIDSIINFMYSQEYNSKAFTNQLKRFTVLDKYRNDNSLELFSKYFPTIKNYIK